MAGPRDHHAMDHRRSMPICDYSQSSDQSDNASSTSGKMSLSTELRKLEDPDLSNNYQSCPDLPRSLQPSPGPGHLHHPQHRSSIPNRAIEILDRQNAISTSGPPSLQNQLSLPTPQKVAVTPPTDSGSVVDSSDPPSPLLRRRRKLHGNNDVLPKFSINLDDRGHNFLQPSKAGDPLSTSMTKWWTV